MRRAVEPRAITKKEAGVVRWLLKHMPTPGIAPYSDDQIDGLQVTATCTCGCYSLFFEGAGPGHRMLADGFAEFPDGHKQNLILWGRTDGGITWLEVNDYSVADEHCEPDVAALISPEEWAKR
jgi:hypothetical protein